MFDDDDNENERDAAAMPKGRQFPWRTCSGSRVGLFGTIAASFQRSLVGPSWNAKCKQICVWVVIWFMLATTLRMTAQKLAIAHGH